MERQMNRQSKRFTPTKWAERIVPVVLAILFLALAFSLVIVFLSMFRLIPGG